MICQTKTIQICNYISNLLANLLIRQTFFYQMLEKSEFAKLFPCQTFLLYGIMFSLKRSSDTTKEPKSEAIFKFRIMLYALLCGPW